MTPKAGRPPLPRAEREALDAIYERLVHGDAAAIAELDAFEHRHPDRLETLRTVAWGLLQVRDWTAGMAPPPLDAAAETVRPDDGAIDIVVCHVALPASPLVFGGRALRTVLNERDHHARLRLGFDAMRRAAPDARRVLISNPDTMLPDDLGYDLLVRHRIRPDFVMLDRLRAYRDHLDAMPAGRAAVAFVDSDVIVCRSPAVAFAAPFSLALTWRTTPPTMPLNGGAIFARRTDGARWLFDRMLECFDRIGGEARIATACRRIFGATIEGWYGDQMAMAALAGWRRFERPPPAPRVFGPGATLAFLPSDPFNFAVPTQGPHHPAALAARVLVHFKGASKHLAAELVPLILAAAGEPPVSP